jgi:hypothetical protein
MEKLISWITIAEDCGFIHFTYNEDPIGVRAMRFGRLRLDVYPSGAGYFTARLLAGASYRDRAIAGAQGKSEDEAFRNLLNSNVGPGKATVSDIIGATGYY